jgi:hypothetical protein
MRIQMLLYVMYYSGLLYVPEQLVQFVTFKLALKLEVVARIAPRG